MLELATTPPPPQINYLRKQNSRGIIFGVIATLSRNQLRKRILREVFLGLNMEESEVSICSGQLRKKTLGVLTSW